MTSLAYLNAPLPKQELNLVCNSITINTVYSSVEISNGPVSLVNGSGTLNLSPENLVNGVFASFTPGQLIVRPPSAALINSYLLTLPQSSSNASVTRFNFLISASQLSSTSINFDLTNSTGVTIYDGSANIIIGSGSPNPSVIPSQRSLTFLKSGSDWVIIF